MEQNLVIRLPAIERLRKRVSDEKKDSKSTSSSKERVRKYRQKLKNDPTYKTKLAEVKKKKKEENKLYKARIRSLRKENEKVNADYKAKQRLWKRNSRKRQAKKKESIIKQSTKQSTDKKITNKRMTRASIRKNAQRAHLPKDSETWASTVSHLIRNATPKRKSLLLGGTKYTERVAEVININKKGRPVKEHEHVKKKLAFSCDNLWKKKKSLKQYQRRKMSPKTPKSKLYFEMWRPKVKAFLEENSRVMPNKKDTILINGKHVAKHHLLCSKSKLYQKFKEANPLFSRKLTTFLKLIPKNFKNLDLKCRRVCVCTKDYNLQQKIAALNKLAKQHSQSLNLDVTTTTRQLSDLTVCPHEGTPNRVCIDRECSSCGTDSIKLFYRPLLERCEKDEVIKYHQWETATESYTNRFGVKKHSTRWMQIEKKSSIPDLVESLVSSMESFTSHIFRADYQHKMESDLMANLPIDQCVAVMDFSENIALQPQDEIESAHWTTKQVTLHPIFIIRHHASSTEEDPKIIKESIIVLSDNLTHDSNAVYVFTNQLLVYLKNTPSPCPVKVLHRFSDNCAAQYKCKDAFYHLFLLEQQHAIQVIYHYTESGHGKGPSDGLGAAIKKKLERLILGGKVINNAYQAYLALNQNQNGKLNQKIIFLPENKMKKSFPVKNNQIKALKGTHSFHMVRNLNSSSDILVCNDLSCSCLVCINSAMEGPCYFSKYQHETQYLSLSTGKVVALETVESRIFLPDTPTNQSFVGDGTNNNQVEGDASLTVTEDTDLMKAVQQNNISNETHLNQCMRQIQTYTNKVTLKGWKVRMETPSDGNCCFWAVSDQLDRVGAEVFTHIMLRHNVVKHMEQYSEAHKREVGQFLTIDVDTYLQEMNKEGTYADHVCLQALCDMLKCSILVVHSETADVTLSPEKSPTLVLGYLPELKHYLSLEPLISLKPEDFVAVKISSGKREKLFTAKVLQIEGDVKLRFLKPTGSVGVYTWADEEYSWQPLSDIVQKLNNPKLLPGRGIKLKFDCEEIKQLKL